LAAETDDAFRQLNDAELAVLTRLGVRRAVSAGEYLCREGDPDYDFYMVLSGGVEIVVNAAGKERIIARHLARPVPRRAESSDWSTSVRLGSGRRARRSARRSP
jgi:CRP-like cAMP-binding protein